MTLINFRPFIKKGCVTIVSSEFFHSKWKRAVMYWKSMLLIYMIVVYTSLVCAEHTCYTCLNEESSLHFKSKIIVNHKNIFFYKTNETIGSGFLEAKWLHMYMYPFLLIFHGVCLTIAEVISTCICLATLCTIALMYSWLHACIKIYLKTIT